MKLGLAKRCTLFVSTGLLSASQSAWCVTDVSFSSTLDPESQSSAFTLETEKKSGSLYLKSDFSGQYASPYLNPQNFDDNLSAVLLLSSTRTFKPQLGATLNHSVRDKITTYGILGGFNIPLIQSPLSLSFTERLSLKRTSIKVNNPSTKSNKKNQPSILQYGLNQSLTLSKDEQNSLSVFYQRFFYNSDVSQLSRILSTNAIFSKKKKNIETVTEVLSTFAESALGASLAWEIHEKSGFKTDYFRTVFANGKAVSEILIPQFNFDINDRLESYIEADFILSEPSSTSYTLAFPYELSDAFGTEIGVVRASTKDDVTWGVLIALTYQFDENHTKLTTGIQNQ